MNEYSVQSFNIQSIQIIFLILTNYEVQIHRKFHICFQIEFKVHKYDMTKTNFKFSKSCVLAYELGGNIVVKLC